MAWSDCLTASMRPLGASQERQRSDARMTCLLVPAFHKGKHGIRGMLPTRAAPVTGTLAPASKTVEILHERGLTVHHLRWVFLCPEGRQSGSRSGVLVNPKRESFRGREEASVR